MLTANHLHVCVDGMKLKTVGEALNRNKDISIECFNSMEIAIVMTKLIVF